MSKEKGVFITPEEPIANTMLSYIRNGLDIKDAYKYYYCGRAVINVPSKDYEEILRKGKKFACESGVDLNWLSWLDFQDRLRHPVSSVDIGYGFFPKKLIPGEEKKKYANRYLWAEDTYTPPYLIDYFEAMKDYLNVDKIYREYNQSENAMTISPNSLDYEKQMELFDGFIEKYGYGPFETIKPLSFTGEIIKNPQKVKK